MAALQSRKIVQDWIRVEDFAVSNSESRTFEYHVVSERDSERIVLTIKCFDAEAHTVRLDPNALSADTHAEAVDPAAVGGLPRRISPRVRLPTVLPPR